MDDEFILCAAIDYNGIIISGARHGNCNATLKLLVPNIAPESIPDRDKQGFLTSKNMFVDRKEAWKIALDNNQIKYGLKASDNGDESILISENLY